MSAIWGRSWLLFSVILVLGLAPVATNAVRSSVCSFQDLRLIHQSTKQPIPHIILWKSHVLLPSVFLQKQKICEPFFFQLQYGLIQRLDIHRRKSFSFRVTQLMNHNLEVVLMTRVPVIVADVLVLILTWVKTYSQVMNARKAGQTMSVSLCLLRDGQWIIFPVSMD